MKKMVILMVCGILTMFGSACGRAKEAPLVAATATEFINPHPASVGDAYLPIFLIEFEDAKFGEDCLPMEELAEVVFDQGNPDSVSYFYNKSSYGNLHMTGDFYQYTAQHEVKYYEYDGGLEELVMEMMTALDDQMDFAKFDQDGDGIMDSFVLSVPVEGGFWYGCQATWYWNEEFSVDGVKPLYYILCDAQPLQNDMEYYTDVLSHEYGHVLGLPDYYPYESEYGNGLDGIAGGEMMDDMDGDFSQFSKLELGWLRENQIQVYSYKEKESFVLPSEKEGGVIIIYPSEELSQKGFVKEQREFLAIEYDTADSVEADLYTEKEQGVRILHARSDVTTDEWASYYTYNGYSEVYDPAEDGIRILRLVNDGEGFYHTGDVVADGTTNFGWYDKNPGPIQDTGLEIQIGQVTEEGIGITIIRK